MAQCRERGAQALALMQRRLGAHDWLTDSGPSVADLALFAYTHVADEGGFDLADFPGVAAWVARVASLPGIETLPVRP
jgi:glutathione S-transferase